MCLKSTIYESTLSTAARSPFPNGEGKEEAASPPKKEANPALLCSAAPSKGRGSRGHSLLPMEGGAPKGRRLDGDSGVKKSEEMHLKSTINESTRAPPKKEANPASLRSAAPSKGRDSRGRSLLPMEGGAPKGRRLDGGKRDEKEGGDHIRSTIHKSTLCKITYKTYL